jgi:hypothetical protein
VAASLLASAAKEWTNPFVDEPHAHKNHASFCHDNNAIPTDLVLDDVESDEDEGLNDEEFAAVLAELEKPVEYEDCEFDGGPETDEEEELAAELQRSQAEQIHMTLVDAIRARDPPPRFFNSADPPWVRSSTMAAPEALRANEEAIGSDSNVPVPVEKTLSWEVGVDWPSDAHLLDGKLLAGKIVQLRCTPAAILTWARKETTRHIVNNLCQAWLRRVDVHTGSLELATASFLMEAIAALQSYHAAPLSWRDTSAQEIRAQVCPDVTCTDTLRIPVAYLAGMAITGPKDGDYRVADIDGDVRMLARSRARLLEAYAIQDYQLVGRHAQLITDSEEDVLQPHADAVAVTVEVASGCDPALGSVTRLAQRLLAVNRVAVMNRGNVHGGLLVQSAVRARVMVLTQTPNKDAITIWMTPPSEIAEHLAAYIVLAVLRRGPQLRTALGELDAAAGGTLLHQYQTAVEKDKAKSRKLVQKKYERRAKLSNEELRNLQEAKLYA